MNTTKPRLTLGIIVKNEEKTLPTLFKSIVPYVDQIVVTDTGSTDKTKLICERYCGKKLKWTEFEWTGKFSDARRFNMEHCDGEWFLWADADDEIIWANKIKHIMKWCEENGRDSVMFPYHYMVDPDTGAIKVLQYRERLLKNDGSYEWTQKSAAVHETVVPKKPSCAAVRFDEVIWVHKTTPERVQASLERNLDLLQTALEEEIKENRVDSRTVYNLGNAYFTAGKFEEAIGCYVNYIPKSGWHVERYLARVRSAMAFERLGNYDAQIEAALTATQDCPQYPDAYIQLGKGFMAKEQYEKALHWLKIASQMPIPTDLPAISPVDYKEGLALMLGHCYIQTGQYKEAKKYFEVYFATYKNDKDVENILKEIDNHIEKAATIRALKVASRVMPNKFWDIVPSEYLEFPELLVEKNKKVKKKTATGKDIAIYCGKVIYDWDETSAEAGGVGGSEEAVINISKHLVSMGWNVTVFGKPIKEGKSKSGVLYKHFTKYNPEDAYDIVISWRNPEFFTIPINAKQKIVWLHDCTPATAFNNKVLEQVDKIFVLSKYHRSLYPHVPEEKFFYTGNGIDPEHFEKDEEKDPFKCIYTSSADRGLEALLRMWPKVREKVPEAHLHWFYGWQTFDKLHENNEQMMAWKDEILKLLDQPGVTDHGRVGHSEIAHEMKTSQLWVYPTEFTEIYCISAVKAQASKALPVTTNVAALDETVQFGTKLDCATIYTDEEAQQKFIDTVVYYLKNPEEVELERDGMKQWAQTQSWLNTAQQWNNLFNS